MSDITFNNCLQDSLFGTCSRIQYGLNMFIHFSTEIYFIFHFSRSMYCDNFVAVQCCQNGLLNENAWVFLIMWQILFSAKFKEDLYCTSLPLQFWEKVLMHFAVQSKSFICTVKLASCQTKPTWHQIFWSSNPFNEKAGQCSLNIECNISWRVGLTHKYCRFWTWSLQFLSVERFPAKTFPLLSRFFIVNIYSYSNVVLHGSSP